MTHWIIPANTKFYDVFGAFREAETYWPVNAKVSTADIVYIYLAAPYKQIGFVCEVLDTNIPPEAILHHVRQFIKGPASEKGPTKQFMKLKPISTIAIDKDSPVNLENLKQNGLTGMLMGARKLENNPTLLKYIKRSLP